MALKDIPEFPSCRVISVGKRSTEAVTRFKGAVVTRHIRYGEGHSPDARAIPLNQAAEARLAKATSNLANAQLELDRAKGQRGKGSRTRLFSAKHGLQAAQAEALAASDHLKEVHENFPLMVTFHVVY